MPVVLDNLFAEKEIVCESFEAKLLMVEYEVWYVSKGCS